MKKILLFMLLPFITILTGCRNDDDLSYDLTLTNSFNTELDIYLATGSGSTDFENRGTINALGEFTIENLLYDTDYTIRSVQFDTGSDNYVTQHKFRYTDTSIPEFTLVIEF